MVLVFGGLGTFLIFGDRSEEEWVAWAEAKFSEITGSANPSSPGERAGPAKEAESSEGPRTAVLPSGQIIEGEFQILSIGDHVTAGDFESALASAIENDPEWLRRLIDEMDVDPNLRITYGNPDNWAHPLEKAVRQGSWESFQILLNAGAEVNGAGSDGGTALHWAAYTGRLDVVGALLDHGADPNLLTAPMQGQPAEDWWTMAPIGSSPLGAAASRGHLEVMKRLLAAGAEPRYELHAAASSGSVEVIEFFLERGADPLQLDGHGDGPLRYATMEGRLDAVQRLLQAGARPGEQALRQAAQRGDDEILRAMAEAGVRFDGPPTYWGPLYSAAYAGRASTVALLLELGASAAACEGQDRPIDAAMAQGHSDVVALLAGH